MAKTLELTAKELSDLGWGPLRRSEGNMSQQSTLISQEAQLRLVPLAVIDTSKSLVQEGDFSRTLRYLENAFYIYRESVCDGWHAPHYQAQDGVYEWPIPTKFRWSNINAVIFGGETIHGPIPEDSSVVKISKKVGDKLEVRRINLDNGEDTTELKDSAQGLDNFHETLRYTIQDPYRIGFLAQQDWQNYCLRNFANPAYWALANFLEGRSSAKELEESTRRILDFLSKPQQVNLGVIDKARFRVENNQTVPIPLLRRILKFLS